MRPTWEQCRDDLHRVFGPDPVTFPPTQQMPMTLEEQKVYWRFLRASELRETDLDRLSDDREATESLCEPCRHFHDNLDALSNNPASDAYFCHLENAQTILSSKKTCILCAFFAFVLKRTLNYTFLRMDDIDENTILPAPLRISAKSSETISTPKYVDDDLVKRKLVGIQLAAAWEPRQRQFYHMFKSRKDLENDINLYYFNSPAILLAPETANRSMDSLEPSSRSYSHNRNSKIAFISGRRPFSHEQQDMLHEWMRKSLQTCEDCHTECKTGFPPEEDIAAASENILPTRLIHINYTELNKQPSLCLVRGVGIRAKYVALSHCWGAPGSQPLTTTKANLKMHQQEIFFDSLPQTFRDAIMATAKLGFGYIWIDSLCIVQDDPDDWEREARRMTSVYGNAWVTIAASHALNSRHGLFLDRRSTDSSISLTLPLAQEDQNQLTLSFPGNAQHFRTSLQSAPLRTRAWCLQEEALSRRILWFTDGEVIWQCRESAYSETGLPAFLAELNIRHRLDNWLEMITECSSRRITYMKDRVIAFQGLVDLAKQYYPEYENNFGHWTAGVEYKDHVKLVSSTKDWLHQLLWYHDSTGDHRDWSIQERADLAASLWPSWSWISHPGGVTFILGTSIDDDDKQAPRRMTLTLPRAKMYYKGHGVLHAEAHIWPLYPQFIGRIGPTQSELHAINQRFAYRLSILPKRIGLEKMIMTMPDLFSDAAKSLYSRLIMYKAGGLDFITEPDAYIIGGHHHGLDDLNRIHGWAALDKTLHRASEMGIEAESRYWACPMMSWMWSYEGASARPFLHQVLILEKNDLEEREEASTSPYSAREPTNMSGEWKGTYRRVGMGILTAEAGWLAEGESIYKMDRIHLI